MADADVVFMELMETFHLSEHHCNQVISNALVSAISSSYCEKWRLLYSHLQLEQIVVSDCDCNHAQEVDKRNAFFTGWKEKKGSEATYKKLLLALLKTGRRQDAEGVCRLMAANLSPSRPSSPRLPNRSTPIRTHLPPLPSCSSPIPTTPSSSFSLIGSPMTPSFLKFPYLADVPEEEKDRLEARLLQESKDMEQKFAILLAKVNSQLEEKGVTVDKLKFLLKNSFHKVFKAVKQCKEFNKFMLKLSDYWSFFDYEMLDTIVASHCDNLTPDMKKYKEDFKLYCNRRICEVPEGAVGIKAQDRGCLFFKCDDNFSYKKTRLWDVKLLTRRLSDILGTKLVLRSVRKGCIELVLSSLHAMPYPLTDQQKTEVKGLGIVQIYRNSREYFIVNDLQCEAVDRDTARKLTYDAAKKLGKDIDGDKSEEKGQIESNLGTTSCSSAKDMPCGHHESILSSSSGLSFRGSSSSSFSSVDEATELSEAVIDDSSMLSVLSQCIVPNQSASVGLLSKINHEEELRLELENTQDLLEISQSHLKEVQEENQRRIFNYEERLSTLQSKNECLHAENLDQQKVILKLKGEVKELNNAMDCLGSHIDKGTNREEELRLELEKTKTLLEIDKFRLSKVQEESQRRICNFEKRMSSLKIENECLLAENVKQQMTISKLEDQVQKSWWETLTKSDADCPVSSGSSGLYHRLSQHEHTDSDVKDESIKNSKDEQAKISEYETKDKTSKELMTRVTKDNALNIAKLATEQESSGAALLYYSPKYDLPPVQSPVRSDFLIEDFLDDPEWLPPHESDFIDMPSEHDMTPSDEIKSPTTAKARISSSPQPSTTVSLRDEPFAKDYNVVEHKETD